MSKRSSRPTVPAVPSRMDDKPTIPNAPTTDLMVQQERLAAAHERAVARELRQKRLERVWYGFVTVGAICGLAELALRLAQLLVRYL